MSEDIDSVLSEINELKKAAFTPAEAQGGGMPPGTGGPPPAPVGPPAGGPPQAGPPPGPQGGQSLVAMLQQAGIDPNMLLQDPNLAQQVAQQAGVPVEQLMQVLQAEMGGGAPAGPTSGAPPPPAGPGPQAGPPPPAAPGGDPVNEIMSVVDQLATTVQDIQAQLQAMQQEHTKLIAENSEMKGQLNVLTKILDSTPEF